MKRIAVLVLILVGGTGILRGGPPLDTLPVRALGGTRSSGTSGVIFDLVVRPAEARREPGRFVLRTVERCRTNALARGSSANAAANLAGRWLEWSVLVALREWVMTPAWWQAELAAVPGAYQDILLWSADHGPVVISCKTSLRERYKQAAFEALAVRQKYPQARCYLVTLDQDKTHVERVRRQLADGTLAGLDGLYDETNLDDLVHELAKESFVTAPGNALRRGSLVR